jgi:Protein of unknown function (DUF3147)
VIVKVDSSGLKQTRWHEYVIRFAMGGLVTVITGSVAKNWGPVIGGLFLAFPAIFPASATLVETHQRQRKQKKGLCGEKRGLDVAAADAFGTALGSLGLVTFALFCYLLLPQFQPAWVLAGGVFLWVLVSTSAWVIRKRRKRIF